LSQEEVDKLNLSTITDEELQNIVRKKLLGMTQAPSRNGQPTDHPKQKVIKVEETNTYLDKGWEYVAKLTENTVVIRNGFEEPNNLNYPT
jgi:flagellar biosynthesis/type III secretory pathway chaperone